MTVTTDKAANYITQDHYRWRNDDGGETNIRVEPGNTSTKTGNQNDVDKSWSHTVSGAERLLLVGVAVDSEATTGVTAITYNGTSLQKLDSEARSDQVAVDLWYLINPDTGTNTVEITATGAFTKRPILALIKKPMRLIRPWRHPPR
jgi:hypothetical protein